MILLSPAECAWRVHRPIGTIYRWVHQGWLVEHGRRGRSKLYDQDQLLVIERATRRGEDVACALRDHDRRFSASGTVVSRPG